MACEMNITIKNSEQTYKQKFLVYETFTMSPDDPVIKKYLGEAMQNAKFEPEDTKIRTLIQVK